MFTRLCSRAAAVAAIAASSALLAAGAAGAAAPPTLTVALNGASGISVSGSVQSGAVTVVSTFTGKLPRGSQGGANFGLVRLDPGVTIQQAFQAVLSHHQDINALTGYGQLFADGAAPGRIQTVLEPGNYVALNVTGNGKPGFVPFTVAQAASPAPLPAAQATESAIEFGFRGPSVLRNGTIVRAENGGWLVHMIDLIGVRNAATGRRVIALLRAGKDQRAFPLISRNPISLIGPVSPGGMQQQVLHTPPGFYVEACFMNTIDGREHTQLGMARLVRVVG